MGDRSFLLERRFSEMRDNTSKLCETLEIEDLVVQPQSFVSPPKWHLGHTTWFLEEILLNKFEKNYIFYNPDNNIIFNSYYKGLGKHWKQEQRGFLSRPTVGEIRDYRKVIEERVLELIFKHRDNSKFLDLLEVSIHHEEQHQELLLMDIKNILSHNPSRPVYAQLGVTPDVVAKENWRYFSEGVYEIGTDSKEIFHFDNEGPRHKVYLQPFGLSERMVTNGEFINFINSGAYSLPALWLSKGFDWVQQNQINSPMYWRLTNEGITEFTLYGEVELNLSAPVTHISYFEADAYARWAGLRLPTEAEFEVSLERDKMKIVPQTLHPFDASSFGSQLWCWTQSHYSPYPRYKPFEQEISEYNGKFMCNQFVLRGGSFATPENHFRKTYRNFYEPDQRWMFSGICLAKDVL